MPAKSKKPVWITAILIGALFAAVLAARHYQGTGGDRRQQGPKLPVPVEVAAIQHGPLSLHRTFSGTIEALARFTVASKVSGRIERLYVDVSEPVTRGQTVARLDDAEFKQAVAEAEARLAVEEANGAEAASRLEIAQRQLDRTTTLHTRGIASDSDLDTARAQFLASQAAVKVAEANVNRERAALTAAQIRLDYTRIRADWEQGDDERVVAERHADEGNTVAANAPLFSIVELDPVLAVIQITEKDYPRISVGQEAELHTDAFPKRVFTGRVSRIAPVFRAASRQARVEVSVPNPDQALKPGMFARCTLVLERVEHAASVPELAITRRENETGVFLVNDKGDSVEWVQVQPGIRDGGQVQLVDVELDGRVVTLGQQLIKDGSAIHIPGEAAQAGGGGGQ